MIKFLCDQMCGELGKWLRVAGYDTVIIRTSLQDREIFKKALEEGRRLITRDHHFKEIDPYGKTVIYVQNEDLDEWADQLKKEGVDWLFRPFSRCLQCNTLLKKSPAPAHLLRQLPKDIQEYWFCPSCSQLFWLGSHTQHMENQLKAWQQDFLTLGFGGDLMIGRLVNRHLDQVPSSYIWGTLLPILLKNDLNLVNLEAALTRSEKSFPKVFHFKADPEKVSILSTGNIEIVNLANNHILDFSQEGLVETLETLDRSKISHVGAGRDVKEAQSPFIFEKKGIRIGVLGCTDNEPTWKAGKSHPGTFFIEIGDIDSLKEPISSLRSKVDLLILSMHWGPNMRKKPLPHFRNFAHALIDLGVDIIHGHSAHVFQGVELYKNKLILYDTGDLVDDYAVDPFLRNDKSFFFIVKVKQGKSISLKMVPILISQFQVNLAEDPEALREMEVLCQEFETYPERKNHFLFLKT